MKSLILGGLLLFGLAINWVGTAHAQLPPSFNGKTLGETVKTQDPYAFSLNFQTLEKLAGSNLNFIPPSDLTKFSLNFTPIVELLGALKERGANVEVRLVEQAGLTVLQVLVDGEKIDSIVVECKFCEIVFEY